MKKILIILISLFICNVAVADNWLKLPKDVVSGWKFFKSMPKMFKDHGMQIVNKKDGYPVRAGDKSIMFEVRPGDCGWISGWSDCENDRERHELSGERHKGKYWYAYSIYLPEDHINIYPALSSWGQFHQQKAEPVFMLKQRKRGRYVIDRTIGENDHHETPIISSEDLLGQWQDILIHAKWSKKDNGFFKVWVNDELKYDYEGQTTTVSKVFFKFGIYRTGISRYLNYHNLSVPGVEECFIENGAKKDWELYDLKTFKKIKHDFSIKLYENCKDLFTITEVPAQVVYFDEVRRGKSKDKVVGDLPSRE